ncbi:MAG: hypothetical protein SFV18_04955 [Bryobacteraceae bacterium]|jgi:hypothetical protein|nr:hypothetical protein [Bryobacteraceae bacterium]
MNIQAQSVRLPEGVMDDLLALYATGEASVATRELIESELRLRPELARKLTAPERLSVPKPSADADQCLRTLKSTRRLSLVRLFLMGFGLTTLLVPLHPFFWGPDKSQRTFVVLAECASAMAWSGFAVVSNKIRKAVR